MKITKFLGLSCFLFAFIATSFPEAVHAKDAAAVLDIFDHDVLAGGRYLIVAPSTENTTTLEVTATSEVICNSDVILSTRGKGIPVTFSPATTSKDGVIREGTIVNVNFDAPVCLMAGVTTMWMIQSSSTTDGYILTTGGVDQLNQFMITKSEGEHGFYQLSFCPMGEPFCTCECVPVGVNGDNHLVPNSGPLLVKFEPDN